MITKLSSKIFFEQFKSKKYFETMFQGLISEVHLTIKAETQHVISQPKNLSSQAWKNPPNLEIFLY